MSLPAVLPFQGREILVKYHKLLSGRGEAPPNSLAALREVLKGGARVIEFDLRTTRDGGYVLLHDETLQRETTGYGRARLQSTEELRRLQLRGSQERMASFDEVVGLLLAVDRPLKVQVDFKETGPLNRQDAERFVEALRPLLEHSTIEIVVGCLADWNLRALHRLLPELTLGFDPLEYLDAPVDEPLRLPTRINAYGYLDDHPLGWRRLQPVADYLADRLESLLTLVPSAREFYLRAQFVALALADGFDPVAFIHEQKPDSLVDIWTVDRLPDGSGDDELRRLLSTGAQQLTTNTAVQWAEAFESDVATG